MPTNTQTKTLSQDATRLSNAWQDGMQALWSGYGDSLRRFTELSTSLWSPRAAAQPELRETLERIAATSRDVTNAQLAVAGEWLRIPYWFTGGASPADLQSRYFQLVDARRQLARAYLDAARDWQRAMTGVVEQVTETVKDEVDEQVQTARRLSNDARDAQQATLDATRRTTSAAQEGASRVVAQAQEVVQEVTERTEQELERIERQRRQEAKAREEQQRQQQAVRLIKGNVNREGEKIYHLPGQAGYDRVQAEETFATEEQAQAAGFRRSGAPGGGTIKGKVNRDGEKIYHLPGQANYERVEADFLFESEEQAQANGFRAAQR